MNGVAAIEAMLGRNPYVRWLGLRLVAAGDEGVRFVLPWRAEFAGMDGGRAVHGGILAAIVDACGSYAVTARTGAPAPTVDLFVDYHQIGVPGDFTVAARVVRVGRHLATAESLVHDAQDRLVAGGRGKYVAAPFTVPAAAFQSFPHQTKETP
jgi:uncharacterized protein (TIGR00369 family)